MFILTLVVPILVFGLFVFKRLESPLARLPGPRYTTFTALWLKFKEFSRQRRAYIHTLHTFYGPVVRLGPHEVSFASGAAMKEIYTSGGGGYDRSELYEMFKQFGTRTLFSMPPKAQHSQRKRIVADRYANTNVMKPEVLDGLKRKAADFLANCVRQKECVDVYVELHCYALDGASQHLFAPYGTNSLNDAQDRAIMRELSYHDSLQQYLFKYYLPAVSALLATFSRPKFVPLANNFVLDACEKRDPAQTSLLAKLQSKAADLEALSAPAECMDHLAAGIDTTGDGLCFLMHQLSLPESLAVQEKLRRELVENPDAPFEQLPYLEAVVKEALRCFPPIPMSFPRVVPRGGRTLDGFFVPEDTIVSCQPWTLHKNETVFPEPLVYRPERWLEAEEERERERMFFAFSQGSRGCLGRQ